MSIIGVGTDVVEIDRFRTSLVRTPGLRDRLFTDHEREYAALKTDPSDRLAARFAAKEATMKALGVGIGAMNMAEIEVVHHDDGRPELVLHAQAAALAAARGVGRWHLSLTHTESVAQAVVIAEST